MKKRLCSIILILGLMWAITGCASFVSPPRIARIQIKGPANQSNEFILSLEDPLQRDTDIHLSDRYAIELDLQWLWYSKEDLESTPKENPDDLLSPLTPWVICKYRF
mgnify:FL=1